MKVLVVHCHPNPASLVAAAKDRVLAGLDAAGRDELDAVLRQAVDSGATVIVASHELERAGSLAHRVIDVVAGQVHESGTTS